MPEPLGRGVCPVRGREGVVDIDVAELGELRATKAGSFFPLPGRKRVFSKQTTSPGFIAFDRGGGLLADTVISQSRPNVPSTFGELRRRRA